MLKGARSIVVFTKLIPHWRLLLFTSGLSTSWKRMSQIGLFMELRNPDWWVYSSGMILEALVGKWAYSKSKVVHFTGHGVVWKVMSQSRVLSLKEIEGCHSWVAEKGYWLQNGRSLKSTALMLQDELHLHPPPLSLTPAGVVINWERVERSSTSSIRCLQTVRI